MSETIIDSIPTVHATWFAVYEDNDGELGDFQFTNDEPLTQTEALGEAQKRIGNDGHVLSVFGVVDIKMVGEWVDN